MTCYICKKYKQPIFCLSNKLLCTNHAKILYNSKITIVQKIYRGYKARKYLKNIYNKLPRDLQIHILQFNSTLAKRNKTIYINKYIHSITYKINNFSNIESHNITLKELDNILSLILKYHTYIEYKWKNYYYYYFKNICYILLFVKNSDTFPYNITYIPAYISNKIYNSINFQPDLIDNQYYIHCDKLLASIYVFFNNYPC